MKRLLLARKSWLRERSASMRKRHMTQCASDEDSDKVSKVKTVELDSDPRMLLVKVVLCPASLLTRDSSALSASLAISGTSLSGMAL